jgi:hypothetical protein
MAGSQDLKDNPFAGLFDSMDKAQQFSASFSNPPSKSPSDFIGGSHFSLVPV